ncbi:MAG: triose-phosphate isomerase [Rhodobacteraceae bacterium]|nr:triose-phosphate isomerase [Paracoccaceae bacterium]
MRRKLIAANWKMNGDDSLVESFHQSRRRLRAAPCDTLVCPPATLLQSTVEAFRNSGILVGGQDCHHELEGAFTGDVSAVQLLQCGATHVIVGHSERRQGHGETDDLIARKVRAAWRVGLSVILCIGESLDQHSEGRTLEVLDAQLSHSLPADRSRPELLTLAYEPVWAIGTGMAASPVDIEEVHGFLRKQCTRVLGENEAADVRILYGGSLNPRNAREILALPNVDGGLIGGASLNPISFAEIAEACSARKA